MIIIINEKCQISRSSHMIPLSGSCHDYILIYRNGPTSSVNYMKSLNDSWLMKVSNHSVTSQTLRGYSSWIEHQKPYMMVITVTSDIIIAYINNCYVLI